ncbi:MAG: FHA domain-containing protein [Tepidiformaceae bacterium]
MDYGTLRVTTPDGQVREYPIEVAQVIIGRSDGNGVVIDHVSVSRRHAQLKLEPDKVLVEDLGSANGTFIGSQRLPANTPTPVTDGQAIRFGDVEAHFIFPNSEQSAPAGAAHGSGAAGDTQGTIGVSLTSPASPVAVGVATTATVVIQNRGSTLDQLAISVVDLPASWVRISRPNISLVAGARDEVTIVIQPPRAAESAAGEHPFSVAVVSSENGREVRVLGTCTVLPFEGFTMALEARGGNYEVVVSNQGNGAMTYALSTSSAASDVNTHLDKETIDLAPGETGRVALSAAPKGRPLFGNPQMRQFRVHAKPIRGAGQEATADGQVSVKPPLRYWKIPVAAVVVLGILGSAGFGYTRGCSSGMVFCTAKKAAQVVSKPNPTVPAGTTAVASPTAAVLRNGSTAVILNSPTGNCLRVRQSHTLQASDAGSKVLGQLCDDQKVKITSDSVTAEGYIWWTIDDGKGLTGWAAEKAADGSGEPFMKLSS